MIKTTKKDYAEMLLSKGYFKFHPYYGKIETILKNMSYQDLKIEYKNSLYPYID